MAGERPCELCGGKTLKVIFVGLPGRLCADESCCALTGLAAWAPAVETETEDGPQFAFFVYEGAYLPALWRWLRGAP